MIVSPMSLTEDRYKAFLLSQPYENTEIAFATRKHESVKDVAAVLHPFSIQVWVAVVLCLCIMPLIFRALLRKNYSWIELFTSAVSSLLNQGTKVRPKKIRECFLLAFWFLGISFVGYSYIAVLLSFLTFPTLEGVWTVKELAEGVKKGEYQCKSVPTMLNASDMLASLDPSLRLIGQSLREGENVSRHLSSLRYPINEKKPAYLDARVNLLPYKDVFFVSDDRISTTYFVIAMRKDFCCKSMLDEVINRFWAAGVFQKHISDTNFQLFLYDQRHFDHKMEKPVSEEKLSLTVFKAPFAFLIVLHLLASFVLLIEICAGKYRQ